MMSENHCWALLIQGFVCYGVLAVRATHLRQPPSSGVLTTQSAPAACCRGDGGTC
nr:MAG TPA: hypothetical protein [Caudoviricetes sp.]